MKHPVVLTTARINLAKSLPKVNTYIKVLSLRCDIKKVFGVPATAATTVTLKSRPSDNAHFGLHLPSQRYEPNDSLSVGNYSEYDQSGGY